ncbi:hypothetical protein FRB99_008884, partial [Tulasnella sp. 403]
MTAERGGEGTCRGIWNDVATNGSKIDRAPDALDPLTNIAQVGAGEDASLHSGSLAHPPNLKLVLTFMVDPPPSDQSPPNEKRRTSSNSVPLSTTVADDDETNEKRTKDFASPSPTSSGKKNLYVADLTTSAFDLDLEAAIHTPPNTTRKSTVHVPPTTIHSNASSPADIGTYPIIREKDDPGPILAANDATSTDAIRGRPRRRTRRANHPTFENDAPPTVRRAQSLPSRAPLTSLPAPAVPQPSMVKTLNNLLQPERKLAPPPSWKDSFWNTIVPLAALLGFATEELALRVGQTLGGLINATFGNAVEVILIIAILALAKGELRIVQASMLGSILSNCLLVLGMCFFAGGIRFHEQGYGVRAAQLNISLLSISVFSIVIPAAFNSSLNFGQPTTITQEQQQQAEQLNNKTDRAVLAISRGTSIILLFVYAAY